MTAAKVSLINACALIGLSLWAYVANGFSSESTLIPVGFGILLLACYPLVKRANRIVCVIATLLTLVIFIALFTPLTSSIDKAQALPIIRVGLMHIATAIALSTFLRDGLRLLKAR